MVKILAENQVSQIILDMPLCLPCLYSVLYRGNTFSFFSSEDILTIVIALLMYHQDEYVQHLVKGIYEVFKL